MSPWRPRRHAHARFPPAAQVQKIIIKSWRKEWKRSLREYEEEQKVPLGERISEGDADS